VPVLVACLVAAWLYGRGLRALWAHAGHERAVRRWQAVCFALGVLTVGLALESPLDTWAAMWFSAHMVQHLLLMLVGAPLIVLSAPLVPFAWGLPNEWRGMVRPLAKLAHVLSSAPLAFALHSLALWLWHVPLLYDAAVAFPPLHVLEHLSFVLTGLVFWWALLGAGKSRYGAGVLFVFGMALESTLLGALLTFSREAWYTAHLNSVSPWGLSPQEDQQLAGLIMWIPGGSIYLVCALALFASWLSAERTPDPAAHTPVRR
jgi:putative membrane protein